MQEIESQVQKMKSKKEQKNEKEKVLNIYKKQ